MKNLHPDTLTPMSIVRDISRWRGQQEWCREAGATFAIDPPYGWNWTRRRLEVSAKYGTMVGITALMEMDFLS